MFTLDHSFKKILIGVDDSPDSLKAFHYAIQRAKKEKIGLTLISVLENSDLNIYEVLNKDFMKAQRQALEKRVKAYCQEARNAGVTQISALIDEGVPGEVIVDKTIPAVKPDLVIVGSKSKAGLAKYFGSQAAYVAKYSPTSVLIVR